MFAGLAHTHNIGQAVRMRHLRSGVERPVPFQDRFFDPNYQTMRKFHMNLLPVRTIKTISTCSQLMPYIILKILGNVVLIGKQLLQNCLCIAE